MLAAKMLGKQQGQGEPPAPTPYAIPSSVPFAVKSGMRSTSANKKITNKKGSVFNIKEKPFDPFEGTGMDYNNFSDMLRKSIINSKP